MAELFKDIPEALANSVEIARRCSLELKLGKSVLPAYPVPEGMTTEDYLARASLRAGLRCGSSNSRRQPTRRERSLAPMYESRLQIELGVICQMGFAGYFLIVADFIRWARENGVPVGPGRGSGAGSLVAYRTRHHGHRSVAVRLAVRTLLESRARVDARLRRRLLHGRSRSSHRIRRAALRPRARLANHHVRHDGGEGRRARRRARRTVRATASRIRSRS